jgi:hypothetical protein
VHDRVSGEVRQRKVVKVLSQHYRKGHVAEDGTITPYCLSSSLPLASELLRQLSWLLPLSDAFGRLRQAISLAP